ncbi:ATP-binding cassette domain-containing protein [Candidatus Pelagibacter sp.]|nr:ATP-binding cassette domain-containing protein [Candidatus Pelagibacter sp.]
MSIIKKFRIKSFKKNIQVASFKNISLSYGERKILDNINFDIYPGEILGLLGPNGVGKSTLFNLLIGLIKPDSGQISINSIKVNDLPIYLRTRKFKIGYVPQYGGYFHDLTLLENFQAIAEIVIKDKRERLIKIEELLHRFELNNMSKIKAKFLSGGQKRKLVICLALLGSPKILLCDEIFAALDVLSIQMLKQILIDLQKEYPMISIVVCEHQARELLSIVDRAMILSKGKIIAKGTPTELIDNQGARSEYFGDSFKLN